MRAISPPSADRPRPAVRPGRRRPVTRSSAIAILGKPALPPDFPLFPLRQPERAEGRRGHARVDRHLSTASIRSSCAAPRRAACRAPGSSCPAAPAPAPASATLGEPADLVGRRDATGYGHLASIIELPADKMWVAFELRPEAKFSDGTPVTAEDVAWTFARCSRRAGRASASRWRREGRGGGRPASRGVPLQVEREPRAAADPGRPAGAAEALLRRPRLRQAADRSADRLRPLSHRQLRARPQCHLRAPPRLVGGRSADRQGTNNFDHVRIEYFRDSTVAMEAFKAGQIDFRSENISKNWATAYDFPAVASGLVNKRDFAHHLPTGMQGYAMNTRRPVLPIRWCARRWPRCSTSSGRTRTCSTAATRAR